MFVVDKGVMIKDKLLRKLKKMKLCSSVFATIFLACFQGLSWLFYILESCYEKVFLLLQTISRMRLRRNILLKTILSWKYLVLKIKLRELNMKFWFFLYFAIIWILWEVVISQRDATSTLNFLSRIVVSLPCCINTFTLFVLYFQKRVNAYLFFETFEDFKPGVDYHC